MSIADIRAQRRRILAQSSPNPSSRKGEIRRARQSEALAIEKDARDHLNRLLLEIAAQPSNDISVLQRLYGNEVEDVIRAAANNAYISGINYLASLKQKQHATYITTPDIQTIKKITTEFEQIFWRRVAAVLHQKDIISSVLSARFSTKSKLSLTNIVSGFVVRMVTKAIALGTLAKSKALSSRARASSIPMLSAAIQIQTNPVKPHIPVPIPTTAELDEQMRQNAEELKQEKQQLAEFERKNKEQLQNTLLNLTSTMLTSVGTLGTGTDQTGQTDAEQTIDNQGVTNADEDTPAQQAADTEKTASPNTDIFEWATEDDDRVCPICQDLDGEQWSADDPDMPEPGDSTHDFCRCRLDLVS